MKTKEIIDHIKKWLISYNKTSKTKGFIIGISGGIDSAVTSTLLAKTKLPLLCLEMPIHQNSSQVSRGKKHIKWLEKKYENVSSLEIDLTDIFESFKKISNTENQDTNLALANTRSRLRMTTLYYNAQINNYLVAGTGNKVEDFGIGFYTKYGDGGVDISPIADLLKSEVFHLGKELGIINEIQIAPPTDGLWDNNQTDEEQIGATYDELEWAMKNISKQELSQKEEKIMNIFKKFNLANKHKMIQIPVCKIPKKFRS
jgi:NAD+ synthase